MWPKALAQLIELAPHITRLVPMADRFLNAKSADAEASRSAMQQMAEGLRGDLGQVTASHAGLYRQLNDQSEKLSILSTELRSTRVETESIDARLAKLQKSVVLIASGLIFTSLALIALLILVTLLYLHHR